MGFVVDEEIAASDPRFARHVDRVRRREEVRGTEPWTYVHRKRREWWNNTYRQIGVEVKDDRFQDLGRRLWGESGGGEAAPQ